MLSAFFRISVRRGPVFTRRRVLPGVAVTIVLWAILSALFTDLVKSGRPVLVTYHEANGKNQVCYTQLP